MAGLDAQDAQDRAVKALGARELRDGDADVVEHPAEASVAGMLDAWEAEPRPLVVVAAWRPLKGESGFRR
jgi:hypothetical protein